MVDLARPVEQINNYLDAPAWPRVPPAMGDRLKVALPAEMGQAYPPNIGALYPNQVPNDDMPQLVNGGAVQPLSLDKAPRPPGRPIAAPLAPPIATPILPNRAFAFMRPGYNYVFPRPPAAIPKAPSLAPPLGSPIPNLVAFTHDALGYSRSPQEPIPRPSLPLRGPAM